MIEELENKKVFKDFNKLLILSPAAAVEKVKDLCADISAKKKFNFEKETQQEGGIVEFLLVENGGVKPKPVEKPKEIREVRETREGRDKRDNNRDRDRENKGRGEREGRDKKEREVRPKNDKV